MKANFRLPSVAALSATLVFCLTFCSKPKYPEGLYAVLQTNKGKIVLRLELDKTPMTVANFVGLAEGTIANSALPLGQSFYDGSEFHRVIPGHVIQAGIPKGAQNRGPGYTFPNEIHPDLSHEREGILGMANQGPHTNSSQFYITLGDRSYLDGDYTVFGQVVEGIEVVRDIAQGDFIENVSILRIGKKPRQFESNTQAFQKLVKEAWEKVKKADEAKKSMEAEIIENGWPQAITTASGLKYVVRKIGQGERLKPGTVIHAEFCGRTLEGEKTFCSDAEGYPSPNQKAVAFEFKIGVTRLIPAVDEALADMRYGEKRILIIPSSLGFAASGFYARQIEGQKRFVISPNTTLIFELFVHDKKENQFLKFQK